MQYYIFSSKLLILQYISLESIHIKLFFVVSAARVNKLSVGAGNLPVLVHDSSNRSDMDAVGDVPGEAGPEEPGMTGVVGS